MFNNKAIVNGNNHTVIQQIFIKIWISDTKWFLNQINWRKKSINLLKEKFYLNLSFENWKFLKDLIEQDKSIIIWNPWSGKTQMIIDLFFQIKNRLNTICWTYYKNDFIPFFIALRDIPKYQTLEQYIEYKKNNYWIKSKQKFILLLDWLDEINNEKIKDVLDFIDNNQDYRYVISSRKTSINLGRLLVKNTNFNEYVIKEFNFDTKNSWNTQILKNYFKSRGKNLNSKKYKKLQIEVKDIFYLEQFFEIYQKLDDKDWKLELIEKYLKEISNKNNELLDFWCDIDKLFKFLSQISGFLYNNNTLILNKENIEKQIEDIKIGNKDFFMDYIIKTFFIEYEWWYSFYHKTFYEYFLTIYITEKYNENKLSIREWNILLDEEYIVKIFFPYIKKKYMGKKSYSSLIGLNLFMQYYLNYNPIDEVSSEKFIKSLFNLPEELLRFYIFEKKSPVYSWFNDFNFLNFSTVKIALDKWYKDIADYFYEKLDKLIIKKQKRAKTIKNNLKKINKEHKRFELEQEVKQIFTWLNFKNQAFLSIKYWKKKSYIELWSKVHKKFDTYIFSDIDTIKDFYDYPIYSFFDDLIKYWEITEIIKIIGWLEKQEFYAFLQRALYLENIVKLLWNIDIFNVLKNKFLDYKWDFKEFIDYKNKREENSDNSVTLFCKYIFWFYENKKEIFESKDFYSLKEWYGWIFDQYFAFYHTHLNRNQLTSYLFYNQKNMKDIVEEEYNFSVKTFEEKDIYRYKYWYLNRNIYIYSYSIFIENLINNKKIDFEKYIKIIKKYSSIRHMDSLDIKAIYSEILAYIYYYNVDSNYIDNLELVWNNLENFIDKTVFYKTIQEIDTISNTNKIQEVITNSIESKLLKLTDSKTDTPAAKTEDYFFISELYWASDNFELQIQVFNRWVANSYVRYWFRKDYYLTDILEILEILKNKSIITEVETFKYIDEIIDLYRITEPITEKWVAYLWKYIIAFIAQFNIKNAEKYKEIINDINYSYNDEIMTSILVQKIKNNSYKDEDIKNIYFSRDTSNLLEMKIYLYLIENWREDYIEPINNLIINIEKWSYIDYYWEKEDFALYEKLYKNGKIKHSDILINLLKEKNKKNDEEVNIDWLKENQIIKILNEKMCYYYSWFGTYNYLLDKLYLKDKELFYKYISLDKYRFYKESKWDFFVNYYQVIKTYVNNNKKKESIKLFEELLDFAKLLIL